MNNNNHTPENPKDQDELFESLLTISTHNNAMIRAALSMLIEMKAEMKGIDPKEVEHQTKELIKQNTDSALQIIMAVQEQRKNRKG